MRAEDLNLQLYNRDFLNSFLRRKGLLEGADSIEDSITSTTNLLLSADRAMNGYDDPDFEQSVIDLINGKIVHLLFHGRVGALSHMAGSAVLYTPVEDGDIDYSRLDNEAYSVLGAGIGVGYSLREVKDPLAAIQEIDRTMHTINEKQLKENKRPTATMLTLPCTHSRVVEFITSKRDADFSKSRVNISVELTDAFMRDVVAGKPDACAIFEQIAQSAHYCGEPGVLFTDAFDSDNPTPLWWPYQSTVSCADMAMAPGDIGVFGHINLAELVTPEHGFDYEKYEKATRTVTRLIDSAIEVSLSAVENRIPYAITRYRRRMGIGVTGLATILKKLGIDYNSQEAFNFSSLIAEHLEYFTKMESVMLARLRGPFPAFPQSMYKKPEWLRRKMNKFEHIPRDRWEDLYSEIEVSGLRNATTTSFSPAGGVSQMFGVSFSIEPEMDDIDCIEPASHLRIASAFQRVIDDSISKTLNLPNETSKEQMFELMVDAWKMNLKGITFFRKGCLEERT